MKAPLKTASTVAAASLAVAGCGSSSSDEALHPKRATTATTSAQSAAVPKLVGVRWESALRRVRRAGLEQRAPGFTGTTGNPGYSGRCLTVTSQSPVAGTEVPRGTTIAVVIGACRHAIIERKPG